MRHGREEHIAAQALHLSQGLLHFAPVSNPLPQPFILHLRQGHAQGFALRLAGPLGARPPDSRFTGNRGIFSVRQKDLDDFAEGRAKWVWSLAYGRSDGLPMLQASCDSWLGALRGTDGRLLFAVQSGVAVVHAADLKEQAGRQRQ